MWATFFIYGVTFQTVLLIAKDTKEDNPYVKVFKFPSRFVFKGLPKRSDYVHVFSSSLSVTLTVDLEYLSW